MIDPIARTDSLISTHFNSLTEFVSYQLPEKNVNHKRWLEYRGEKTGQHNRGGSWFGPTNNGVRDVMDHALLGDDDLGNLVTRMWSELDDDTGKRKTDYKQHIKVAKRRRIKSDFGDELDIHKVYQGQLDKAWSRTERIVQDSTHSLVTLFIDIGANCTVNANDTLWRAAVATRLVSELEAAGKAVKIVVGGALERLYHRDKRQATVSAVVKEFNRPLSIDRLAAMAHVGFYRSFGFASMQVQNTVTTGGLGYTIPVGGKNIPIQLQEEVDEGHTRFVHIGVANNLCQAVKELNSAYEQIEKYSLESHNG